MTPVVWATSARLAICLRIAVALLSVTYFQPDEYFQALEPAHHLVFGYGHLTWEWRTRPPIRSIFFPMLFAPVYWMLKILGLDEPYLLVWIWAPKVVQGLFASITDVAVRRLARNTLGDRYVSMTFFLSLTSLFHLQALSRTLSNSLETSLTTLALSYWPFATFHSSQQLIKPLIVAAITCMIRPTNAIIWSFLIIELSWRLRHDSSRLLRLWSQVGAVGAISCTSLFLLDSWYFRTPTFTPLNFLITNMSPVSTFYGRSPWHYYLTQAIPILCNVTSPFVVYSMWHALRNGPSPVRRLVALILWVVFVYSLAAHKEWRFIHPLLPAMHAIASKPIVDHDTENHKRRFYIRAWRMVTLAALAAAPYILFVQSRAQIAVMNQLRSIPAEELRSIGYLMPCHSTPWQSHLHRPHLSQHSHWALGCEPPIGEQEHDIYKDQSDLFYASPISYLQTMFPTAVDPDFPPSRFPASVPGTRGVADTTWAHSWPSHLVFFGSLLNSGGVQPLLEKLGYREYWYGWNGWEQDERRREGVRVWAWRRQNTNPSAS
ncbi:glycosyltransferase family 22 protein [Gautieria morchelliformis]|nr:glycosyltransferase family 22 protein [Gautieria morchelliformis]